MKGTPLTQEMIDGGIEACEGEKNGHSSTTGKLLTGAAILAGAGLAYAAVKTIKSTANNVAQKPSGGYQANSTDGNGQRVGF